MKIKVFFICILVLMGTSAQSFVENQKENNWSEWIPFNGISGWNQTVLRTRSEYEFDVDPNRNTANDVYNKGYKDGYEKGYEYAKEEKFHNKGY